MKTRILILITSCLVATRRGFLTAAASIVLAAGANAQWVFNPANGHEYRLTCGEYWGASDTGARTLPDWFDAEAEAVASGGHLATIHDEAENQWLVDTFGNNHYWIGLTDWGSEGSFYWITGEPVTYLNWDAGQPDNAPDSGEDTVHINHFGAFGYWNDLDGQFTPADHPNPYRGIIEREEPGLGDSPPVAIDDFYGVDQLAALNEPAPGVLVNDSDPDAGDTLTAALVTGPAHARSFDLNSNGSFAYVPVADYSGPDTFTYRAYDDTLCSIATVHITVRQPCSSGGFITGGGKFFQDGRKCTFGFVAKVQGNGAQGNLEFQDHDMGFDVKAGTMAWVYAPNEIDGSFSGTCRVNGVDGHTFFVQVHDRGQPGSNDDFSIWVYDPYGAEVYTSGGLLSGGNILIHETADVASPSREWFCDYDGDGYRVSAGVSCTAPSPECSYDNVGLGADCDDNDPTATSGGREWFYDCDQDGYSVSAGFSCTAPPCTPCCPILSAGSGRDCFDDDFYFTCFE